MAARGLYNALLPLALAGARASALFLPKMREAIEGRRGFRERFAQLRGLDPPVWFHVSSVGEFEQARPLITLLGRRHPHIPVVLTFSSPSGYHFARRREKVGEGSNIVFIDYLPADTRGNMQFCLDCVNPRALVLVKFDLWPNLIWETKRRGVGIVLVDATLSPSSRRLSGPARWLYRSVYECIDRIIAISDADAKRFADAVPGHGAIEVAGDTRFDRVMERWEQRSSTRVEYDTGDGPVLIAGSTWPADEARLLDAVKGLLDAYPSLRFIVAPHEPSPAHVAGLEGWARGAGISARTVSADRAAEEARVLIIDTVGILAEAYRLGDIAYVGGSFSTGVHSVIEPAIAGLPVVFGPRHDNSFEALQLIERGGGFCVHDGAGMAARLESLVGDDGLRARSGEAASTYVASQLGASEKCMAVLEGFL
jgi:3-deoxy-D-manno-octulosonic-acid transferase